VPRRQPIPGTNPKRHSYRHRAVPARPDIGLSSPRIGSTLSVKQAADKWLRGCSTAWSRWYSGGRCGRSAGHGHCLHEAHTHTPPSAAQSAHAAPCPLDCAGVGSNRTSHSAGSGSSIGAATAMATDRTATTSRRSHVLSPHRGTC